MFRPVAGHRADKLGIYASVLCAVHCALGAIFSSVSAFLGWLFHGPLETTFTAFAFASAIVGLGHGARRHHLWGPLALGAVGLSLLAVGRVTTFSSEVTEASVSILGAIALITAHGLNLRALRGCHGSCSGDHGPHGHHLA